MEGQQKMEGQGRMSSQPEYKESKETVKETKKVVRAEEEK
jgi:hypothetical protein